MKGFIFDLDGVLVNSMPTHYEAWKRAFKKITGIDVTTRDIYLLEGMRGIELVKKIFEQKNFHDILLAEKVSDEKNKIFKKIRNSKPFAGVKKMIADLSCPKAVVSGSAKKDVFTILEESIGKNNFEIIITADDIKKGKPDPTAFLTAVKKLKLNPSDCLVVENAPLGVMAANNAKIGCLVVLNNTPLGMVDFRNYISEDKIFEKTGSIAGLVREWCK